MIYQSRIVKPDGTPLRIQHFTDLDGWRDLSKDQYDRGIMLDGKKFLTCDARFEFRKVQFFGVVSK